MSLALVVLVVALLVSSMVSYRLGGKVYRQRWLEANRLLQARLDSEEDELGGLRVVARTVTMQYTAGDLKDRKVQGVKFVVLGPKGETVTEIDQNPGRVGLPFAEDDFDEDYEKYRKKAVAAAKRLAQDYEGIRE